MSGKYFTAHFNLSRTTFAVLSLNTPIFSWMFVLWQDRSNCPTTFLQAASWNSRLLHCASSKGQPTSYSESFLVLFSSARSISGKQLASFSLSLFNYSLKGYYYYNYVLWPFDQQELIGYFFFAVMFGVTKHTIANHCYVNPHSADSPTQKKTTTFFSKLVFHFYYTLFFYKNNFIRKTRLKFTQKLRTS